MNDQHDLYGESGLEFSSVDWLRLHHLVKINERLAAVSDLGIRPGQRILDVGCGPGLWTELLAHAVGPTGTVVGIDRDRSMLNSAWSSSSNASSMRPLQAEMLRLPFCDDSFDLVFCNNCYGYLEDPDAALREQIRVTAPGGRIAARHWDETFSIFHPIPHDELFSVLQGAIAAQAECQFSKYFDNSFGQKMPALFWRNGCRRMKTRTLAFQRVGPLDAESREFVRLNGLWLLKTARSYLTEEQVSKWLDYFSKDSPNSILDRPDFYYCGLEVETIATIT